MGKVYACTACGKQTPEEACLKVGPATRPMLACPACRMHVVPVVDPIVEERARSAGTFVEKLARAFAYPFAPWNLVGHLGAIVAISCVLFLPLFGAFLAGGIFFGYLLAVLRAGTQGLDHLGVSPDDIDRPATWWAPYGRLLVAALVAFAPALLATSLHDSLLTSVLAVAGGLLFPAQVIVSAHGSGCLGPLNPVPSVKLILVAPGPYAITLVGLAITSGLTFGLAVAFQRLEVASPLLGAFFARLVVTLPIVVAFRMMGVLAKHVLDTQDV